MLGRCQGGASWETSQDLGLVAGTEDLGQSLGCRAGGPIDGHIHHPLPRSHLSALLSCSHPACLLFFFITTVSPGPLHILLLPHKELFPECPDGSLPGLLLVSSLLSACRRPSLSTSCKTATGLSLVLLSYPVSPLLLNYVSICLFHY